MTGENLLKIFNSYVGKSVESSSAAISIPFEVFLIVGGIVACIFAVVCIYFLEADFWDAAAASVVILMIIVSAGAVFNKESLQENEMKYQAFEQEILHPYLFNNDSTKEHLKRYEVVSFNLSPEIQKSDVLSGTVLVSLSNLMIDFDLSQLVVGKTEEDSSFILENQIDVTLNKDYPKGKAFHALYLTDNDYTLLAEYFKIDVTLTSK